jgi:ABC-type Na+ efflux pump permease subunit
MLPAIILAVVGLIIYAVISAFLDASATQVKQVDTRGPGTGNNTKVKRYRLVPGLVGLFAGAYLSFVYLVSTALTGVNGFYDEGKHENAKLLFSVSFAMMILVPLWYLVLRVPYCIGRERNRKWQWMSSVVLWWMMLVFLGISFVIEPL